MSIGRQGFVERSGNATPHVPVPWIGRWVEAYFADNRTQFAGRVADPYPFMRRSANYNSKIRKRSLPSGAMTTESWDKPHWDLLTNEYLSGYPSSALFSSYGHYLNIGLPTATFVPYANTGWAAYGAAKHPAGYTRTITAADLTSLTLPSTGSAILHFALHFGTITNVTTGATFTVQAPAITANPTTLPLHLVPKVMDTMVVSFGDVITLSVDAVTSTRFLLTQDISSIIPAISGSKFALRFLDNPMIARDTTAINYFNITDAGYPNSFQGVPWANAIYQDVPAYRLTYEFQIIQPDFNLSHTFQGGAGITSYHVLNNNAVQSTANGFYNIPLSIGVGASLPLHQWITYEFYIKPVDPTTTPNGEAWITEVLVNGVSYGTAYTSRPDANILATPNISLGAFYFTPSSPMLMRNLRMEYWKRL